MSNLHLDILRSANESLRRERDELRAEVAKWKHDAELAMDLEYNQGQRVDELRAENKRLAENSYRDLTRIGELLAENERLNRQLALPSALPTTLYGDGVIWN